jgi:hypothetical protein
LIPQGPQHFEVLPENWEAVRIFSRLGSQWKIGAFGGFIGLDYPALESALRMMRILPSRRPGLFESIQIMEAAALEVLNEEFLKKPKA